MTTRRSPHARTAALGAAVAVLAVLAGIGVAAGAGSPAGAAETPVGASCAPGQGVTVVVDFNGLPGGIQVACAVGPQASGFAALAAAGFTADNGGNAGIVCQIDGVPVEGYPYCWTQGGYWAYWKKPRGGSWTYSGVGAAGASVGVDMVEGWSWAADFVNQAPRADESTVPPATSTTTTTTSPASSTTTSGLSSTTTSTTSPTDSTSTTDPVEPTSTSTATGRPTPTGGTATSAPDTAPGGSPSTASGPGGDPAGTAATTALARTGGDVRGPLLLGTVLVIAGAGSIALARRSATSRR